MLKTSFGDLKLLKPLKKQLPPKQRTKGLFFESLEVIPDPGTRMVQERSSLIEANPELQKLMKRKERLEERKMREKKE